jgi:hypothetical protein
LGCGFDSHAVKFYGLVLPEIRKTLHITETQAGLAATADSLAEYQIFAAVSIATLGWPWGVGDTYIAESFPTVLRGTGFGIAVGGPSAGAHS